MAKGALHLQRLLVLLFLATLASATADVCSGMLSSQIDIKHSNAYVPAMFVFGDSVLDAGTNSFFPSLLQADFQPYGQYFGKPTGRFTNGRTYADFFAIYIGLAYPEPYFKRKGAWSIMAGVNYASAGSGLLTSTNAANKVIPFPDQIAQFNETKLLIEKTLKSEAAAWDLFSKSLFLINIGGNDLIGYLFAPTTPQDEEFSTLFVILNDSISTLYKAGARKFMLLGIGPVGCVPGVLAALGITTGECLESFNLATRAFNTRLEQFVSDLQTTYPEIKAIVGKPYNKLSQFFVSGNNYGFTAGVSACCGSGIYNGLVQCGRPADLITNPPTNLCENVEEHVFWDYYHPTDKAYGIVAKEFWEGNTTYVAPMNLRTLVSL